MKITNGYQENYQQNFKGGKVDWLGRKVLSQRLKPAELQAFIERFKDRHNSLGYDIVLGGLSKDNPRLDACITYEDNSFRHMTEGKFSSLFRSPKSFMKRINNQIQKDFMSLATKNKISTSLKEKIAYFCRFIV